uniref:Uncharacterized protein n=1 Tax=Physcomitrium patens TaxID=3218 RepID=A0A2K1JD83_PHYPA|nr:hypothetical protein PHYPA_019746 [Physcomitrium patens]
MVVPEAVKGIALPFEPLSNSFECINYCVDMPPEMKHEGLTETKLKLLSNITSSFRPGVLTAGRKTGEYVEGNIRISGFSKVRETFSRISGYCEQNDIHSPQLDVRESLMYSAWLCLDPDISDEDKLKFVDQVMELMELSSIEHALVGLPGTSGLSTYIDIVEAFDELLLLKRGGRVICNGPFGHNSEKVIEYFQAIPGVTKIKEGYNPATWMLEVVNNRIEDQLGVDFAELYLTSDPYQFKSFVLRNAVLAKLLQPVDNHLVEAIYHVLTQSRLQPRTLYLYAVYSVDFGQLVPGSTLAEDNQGRDRAQSDEAG